MCSKFCCRNRKDFTKRSCPIFDYCQGKNPDGTFKRSLYERDKYFSEWLDGELIAEDLVSEHVWLMNYWLDGSFHKSPIDRIKSFFTKSLKHRNTTEWDEVTFCGMKFSAFVEEVDPKTQMVKWYLAGAKVEHEKSKESDIQTEE